MNDTRGHGLDQAWVSVPYRGATFLNNMASEKLYLIGEKVSVPYRGATFLNSFSRNFETGNIVSVPYRGATFLNEPIIAEAMKQSTVSVPYRGATFLNYDFKLQRSDR